MYASYLRSLKR